jgi:hypothetical protein
MDADAPEHFRPVRRLPRALRPLVAAAGSLTWLAGFVAFAWALRTTRIVLEGLALTGGVFVVALVLCLAIRHERLDEEP